MKPTEILKGEADLKLALEFLEKGEPVVMPTETVYGLAAPLFNEQAVRRIFEIKGRPLDNPLIAHVSSIAQAESLAEDLPDLFYLLANRFWPGPLTLVVKKKKSVPNLVSAGQPTVAIRMPSHPIAKKFIESAGQPLVAPSANLSGKPSPTRLRDVLEDLEGKVGCAIDGGDCEIGIESTVLSLYHPIPTLLRPGSISKEVLERAAGVQIALPSTLASAQERVLSPGMKYRHYAPNAEVKLVYRTEELEGPFILSPVLIPGKTVRPLNEKVLYAQLREADRLKISKIEIFCPPSLLENAGLMNRLLLASASESPAKKFI
jgi:L-threonylcarbamoyladenylate synthase